MAKSSLAGADGALTWVVSAARAGALFVGRGRGGRGPGARRAGALSGRGQGLTLPAFSPRCSPPPGLRPRENARPKLQGAHQDVGARADACLLASPP